MTNFSISGRDTFPRPYKNQALTPSLVISPQQSLAAIEALAQFGVGTAAGYSHSNTLACPVQRWLFTYDGTQTIGGTPQAPIITLPLSAAILEDAGLITAQGTNPIVSLASSNALDGSKSQQTDFIGINGSFLPPPGWVRRLQKCPIVNLNVRMIGATGNQTIGTYGLSFFDAGSGVSPSLYFFMNLSCPDNANVILPAGRYEACLLIMNWV